MMSGQYHAPAEQARAGVRTALDDEARLLRRKGLTALGDACSWLDRAQTTSLDQNGPLQCEDSGNITVFAALEEPSPGADATVRSHHCDKARPKMLFTAQRYLLP